MSKIGFYKVLLIILIISTIATISIVAYKYIQRWQNEQKLKETILMINTQEEATSESEEIQEQEIDVLKEMNAEINGHSVVGIIKIPEINLEYPILETTSVETLKLSITRFWGEKINQIGNVTLAGHNNLGGTMFGKIKHLEEGDIIELTDKQNVTIKYQIFKKYIIDPNDVTCVLPEQKDTREVTLITCTNGNKNRFIIKAREVI